MLLYFLATLLTFFIGFRDAAGRHAGIHKTRYYVRCMTYAVLFGQAGLLSLLGLAWMSNLDFSLLHAIEQRAAPIYGGYTGLVLCTFIPYAIPNWEIKSLVTVLVFGPLTLLQPLVIIVGGAYAIQPYWAHHQVVLFTITGMLFCLLFESILSRLGYAKRLANK